MSYGLSLTARSPAGIGGGLAFIAFFIVSRAIGHAMDIAGAASSYDAAISSATDAPVAAWAFSGHIVGQAVLLLGAVAVFALLWRHSRFLPRVLLAWLVAEIAIGAVEAAWLGGLLASAGFALTGGPYDPWWIVVRSVAALAIFAAYLRLSRRARLTFVR